MAHEPNAPEAVRIVGGVGTGKTERLVERASRLASTDGPRSVVAFCATPLSARAFAARLRERLGDAADEVRITTPRAFALEVLGDEKARNLTGRDPRLLTAVEEKFLVEDLKVSGIRPKRLREMLKFFYRSWTELSDDDPDWLLPGEETELHGLLKESLGFMRAVIEPEAANLAVNYLRSCDAARSAHLFAHVVVDDHQCLNRASQLLAELVADTSIAVAGNPDACVQVFDSYPYATGLDEFADRHPNASLVQLDACLRSKATARAAANMLADPAFEGRALAVSDTSGEGRIDVLASNDPADEFARAAAYLADAARAGASTSRMAVAVPNDVWARNMVAALEARGMRAEALPTRQPLKGDVRDLSRCAPARMLTALALVADSHDATAWRCWCGFGDHLLNSSAFASLRGQGLPLADALARTAAGFEAENARNDDAGREGRAQTAGIVGAQRVVSAYHSGLFLISRIEQRERRGKLEGRALLDEIARLVTDGAATAAPDVVTRLCLADDRTSDNANDASSMVRRARERLCAPILADESAVAVVPYDLTVGLSPETLVIVGFVNGFIPCRDYFDTTVTTLDKQKKMHAVDARRVYALVGKAERTLALSHFSSIDLESAGALKLKIDRIKLRDGVRTCSIAPSDFLSAIVGEA
ncbi:hypothetical protein B5F40_14380 [Gordonibacter sp. An230]|uniref:UvrD-helicase domain-containing protein n=1 Tax=Gordonibacter sp. An230 TaxID=1965592 RepID=UPI000B365D45|nr:UvrD-helicase domain-containing protein [Gordonibacter sp. An230]OUO86982.1 hypothetical protein B5F40_14380 [Gordonibacter sp. An230]